MQTNTNDYIGLLFVEIGTDVCTFVSKNNHVRKCIHTHNTRFLITPKDSSSSNLFVRRLYVHSSRIAQVIVDFI